MSSDLHKQIRDNLNLKETDELLDIWMTNDHVEWSDTAFAVIKEILEQRLGEAPLQGEPIFEHIKQEIPDTDDENVAIDKWTDPNNPPVFYKPKEVLRLNLWLNRLAVAAIAVTILVSIPTFINLQRIILAYFNDNPQWDFVAWLIATVIGGLAIALQCLILYYSLKALAGILKILMEMEFNSRPTKQL